MAIPAEIMHIGMEVFLLVFVRMTGLFVVAPVLGKKYTHLS